MIAEYFPILLFIVVGVTVGLVLPLTGAVLSRALRSHNPDAAKLTAYECGFDAFEDARTKFDVRYYLVAILFIIFDLEIAFLFPLGGCARPDWFNWFCRYDDFSYFVGRGVYLRMEKRSPRLGLGCSEYDY
jgi:NADH-quinone oxidoreductase subunit A